MIQSLQSEVGTNSQQTIITTHSPILASVVELENITIIKDRKGYPLSSDQTKLSTDDYRYLERYLDSTKANLFFAKGVIVVEGAGEELLLPTIARLLGYDLTEHGISIVNARGTGLSRFSNIFQRKDEAIPLNIKVACITDTDIMPDCAPAICIDSHYTDISTFPCNRRWKILSEITDINAEKQKKACKNDGQSVRTFLTDTWTLEYELATSGLSDFMLEELIMLTYATENREKKLLEAKNKLDEYASIEEKASFIYSFFTKKNVSKAEFAQGLSF